MPETWLALLLLLSESQTEQWWTGKDLEGCDCGLTEVICQHLPKGEIKKKSWQPVSKTRFKPGASKYKSRPLLIHQPVWYLIHTENEEVGNESSWRLHGQPCTDM